MDTVQKNAIVLCKDPHNSQKFVVLDKDNGKITCFVRDRELHPGVYIEYVPLYKRRIMCATDIRILYVPFALARKDIVFMHNILELCRHFIPEGTDAVDIFHLLEYLYTHAQLWHDTRAKKLYMCKLFILFGMYPDADHLTTDYWHMLQSMAIDRIVELRIDLKVEKEIDSWLRSSIMAHPAYHSFKITFFLDENW